MTNLISQLDERVPCLGIVFILISSFFATGGKYFVKLLDLHSLVIVLVRCGLLSVFWLFVVAVRRDFIFGQSRTELKLLILRGVLGFTTFLLSYYSLSYIPLADATTIILSTPIYTSVFAHFLLNERCGPINIALIGLTLCGVIMIARPSFLFNVDVDSENETNKIIGTTMAFVSSIVAALANIIVRKLKDTSVAVVITWFTGTSFLLSFFGILLAKFLLPHEHTNTIRLVDFEEEFYILVLNSICGIFAQLCITLALKVEEAGTISLARSVDILLSFIFQSILLKHEPIYWTSIVGSLIIATGVTLSALYKIKQKRIAQSNSASSTTDTIKKLKNTEIDDLQSSFTTSSSSDSKKLNSPI